MCALTIIMSPKKFWLVFSGMPVKELEAVSVKV